MTLTMQKSLAVLITDNDKAACLENDPILKKLRDELYKLASSFPKESGEAIEIVELQIGNEPNHDDIIFLIPIDSF